MNSPMLFGEPLSYEEEHSDVVTSGSGEYLWLSLSLPLSVSVSRVLITITGEGSREWNDELFFEGTCTSGDVGVLITLSKREVPFITDESWPPSTPLYVPLAANETAVMPRRADGSSVCIDMMGLPDNWFPSDTPSSSMRVKGPSA